MSNLSEQNSINSSEEDRLLKLVDELMKDAPDRILIKKLTSLLKIPYSSDVPTQLLNVINTVSSECHKKVKNRETEIEKEG